MPTGEFLIWLEFYGEDLYSFIAEVNGEPIGMALIREDNNESGVYVRPKHRRKGVGHALIKRMSSKFPNAKIAHHNVKSYRLFSKLNKKLSQNTYAWHKLKGKYNESNTSR